MKHTRRYKHRPAKKITHQTPAKFDNLWDYYLKLFKDIEAADKNWIQTLNDVYRSSVE